MTHFYFPHFVYYVCLLITRFLSLPRFCCNLPLTCEREREPTNLRGRFTRTQMIIIRGEKEKSKRVGKARRRRFSTDKKDPSGKRRKEFQTSSSSLFTPAVPYAPTSCKLSGFFSLFSKEKRREKLRKRHMTPARLYAFLFPAVSRFTNQEENFLLFLFLQESVESRLLIMDHRR